MKTIHFFAAAAAVLLAMACELESAQPSQDQQPNPLPVYALVKQLKWSDLDHHTFAYNTRNQVTQVRSQWQYEQGDPTKIRTIIYDFEYNPKKQLSKVYYSGGFFMEYYYKEKLIDKVIEYFPGGAVKQEFKVHYRNNRIATIHNLDSSAFDEAPTKRRYDFYYDAKGNMNRMETWQLPQDAGTAMPYKLIEYIDYSDFDNDMNPLSWMEVYPYLPNVRWQFNNPRKVLVHFAGTPGSNHPWQFAYAYNAWGLPVSRTKISGSRTTTVNYIY